MSPAPAPSEPVVRESKNYTCEIECEKEESIRKIDDFLTNLTLDSAKNKENIAFKIEGKNYNLSLGISFEKKAQEKQEEEEKEEGKFPLENSRRVDSISVYFLAGFLLCFLFFVVYFIGVAIGR